jgi:hypothetical protein
MNDTIYTMWFKYDQDDLCVNKSQFVPVIFEPPCTLQMRRGYSSMCFLIEPWHIKENVVMVENIPKTDSLCYYVLIMMEVTNKCRL